MTQYTKKDLVKISDKNGIIVSNAYGSSKALIASETFNRDKKTIVVLSENDAQAQMFFKEVSFFSNIDKKDIFYFPDTETLPYDQESPHPGLTSERGRVLHDLAINSDSPRIIITSIANAIRKISSLSHWETEFLQFSIGDNINLELLSNELNELGYVKNLQEVSSYGEYTVKDNIIDLFPLGQDNPVRIRVKNNSIYKINEFSPVTQRSVSELISTFALSAKEMPVNEEALDMFRIGYRKIFRRVIGDSVYESVLSKDFPSGVESYLPLFQKETSTIFDYLKNKEKTKIVCLGEPLLVIDKVWEQINNRYNDLMLDKSRRIIDPNLLWIGKEELKENIGKFKTIYIKDILKNDSSFTYAISCRRNNAQRYSSLTDTVEMVDEWAEEFSKIIFCLHSDTRESQLRTICEMADQDIGSCESWDDALKSNFKAVLVFSPIDDGFILDEHGIIVVSEKEMFGQVIFAKDESDLFKENDAIDYQSIQDLKNLSPGDPIVHFSNGVGRFKGLTVMPIQGVEREWLQISYDNSSTAFVAMDDLDMVSRYGGLITENAPLHATDSEKWSLGLAKAVKSIVFTAETLIQMEKDRKKEVGIKLEKPKFEFQKFCKEFPFQETRDQKSAVQDIINDLIKSQPMNRTIVGDVGFGKTEVAMKAAFLVASQGYSVAVLAPTTLLAMQHYESFKKRFEYFDISIDCLSRYKDKKSEREAIKRIESGETKIVIGTTRIIQKDVVFNNIGLLVVDEEHRFGVAHKNKIKDMRKKVNVLSMSATPIPRTLSMSLHGVRDISIIATPPAKRLSIRTILSEKKDGVIKEAIDREMMRNGQTYVLHNSVSSIEDRAKEIRELIPGARVAVGHGRMHKNDLEIIMSKFYKGEYDILVCTTIIETGIDIPNANTILIEKADRFGIAQLHQLRGRVGRSNHQAYAYLLTDSKIGDVATERLKVLEKATKLGEGLVLASHDLEIRGTGEILGEEQSGQMQNIGFTLYMRLLSRAIELIKSGKGIEKLHTSASEVKVDLGISGLIDSSYVQSQQSRLSLYKRFSSVNKIAELSEIEEEMTDKFGPIPDTTMNIIKISKIRCYLKQMGVSKLSVNGVEGILMFGESSKINKDKLMDLIDSNPESYKLKGPLMLHFNKVTESVEERLKYVISLVTSIV